jgi:acyl carrier protein
MTLFPELSQQEVRTASIGTIPQWDSLAWMTLISLLEEQFDIEISGSDIPTLVSYEQVCDYLAREGRLGS